jgi:hypothetical protein
VTRLLLAVTLLFGACGARQGSTQSNGPGPVVSAVVLVAAVVGTMAVIGLVADCEQREGGHCGSSGARQGP